MDSSRLTGPPMPLRIGGQVLPMVGRVRMYVCGITPYDVTHLGHAATYIWADAADRVLRWHGHTVTLARNVTDVDDVLFAEARRRGESSSMLATLQRASFEATMAALRVRNPDHAPTATQAVGHVVQLAAALLARDAAYLRGGTVYARTSNAAELAGLDSATALALSHEFHDHPDDPAKDHPLDVAVWQETTDEEISWPSPWGEGRPGWHAECAAMVLALFGPSIDLHCGGADLTYPHHACEAVLAQSATGVAPFSRAWLRAGTVGVGGAKMAKSTGNLVLVDDLLREHSGAAVRLLCLNRRWSHPWSYSSDTLDAAGALLDELYAAAAKPGGEIGVAALPAALLDDLDVPRALDVALEDGGQAARTLIEILALS
jgi:cysteinyl-tRNA synthetase